MLAMGNYSKFGVLLLGAVLCLTSSLRAEDLEYKMEIGGMVGGSYYLGDANFLGLFKEMNMMGGIVARYNLNPRMSIKGNLAVAGISGTTTGSEYRIPGDDIEFSRTLYDLGAQFEYNFLAYGTGGGYKRTYRIVPYLFGGVGITFAPEPAKNVFTANMPMGVGVKYKFAPRFNLGCELSFRFTLSDDLDVDKKADTTLNDPYGIKSSGLKNKDSYSFLSIFLTYDIFPKYRKCNN